ncbi:MAG: chemotaxis protein CheW [Thermodesulfobacteriota bacterium]
MDIEKIFNVGYQGFTDGSVQFYSPRIIELTGYDMEEFNSKSVNWVRDIILPEDEPLAREALIKALKGDKIYTRSYRIRTKSGETKWILELSQILLNEAGKIDYVTGTLIDITAEKEEELVQAQRARLTGKYLFFSLKGQDYGISIQKIREIIGLLPITAIPETPDYFKGVVNLRGRVIPVIDLRLRLGVDADAYDDRHSIIVVEAARETGVVLAGVIVDGVSEVVPINGAEVEDLKGELARVDSKYLLGIAKIEGGVKILLDIDQVVPAEEISQLQSSQS